MLSKHEAFTEIRQKKLIDIEIALANGAWAISRCLHLAGEIEQASAQSSEHARKDHRKR